MTISRFLAAPFAASFLLLAACAGGSIEGRVIAGPASVVQKVAAGADRPDQTGLKGVTVEVRAVGRAGSGPVIGSGTSGASGRFTVPYKERRMVRDRLQLVARADGYIPVQEDFFLPGTGQMLLVVMKPNRPPAATPPAPPPATPLPPAPPPAKPPQ